MKQTIGSCSICGGPVTTYTIWHGILPPPVSCEQCGAQRASTGPVIPMTPGPRQITTGTTSRRFDFYTNAPGTSYSITFPPTRPQSVSGLCAPSIHS